jgi:glycosyltransferase involved in cell wall biosynthesis
MGILYIDLTDLVVNSIYHGVNTGIQRVQIFVAHSLIKTISARTFSVFEGRWESLDDIILGSQNDVDACLKSIRQKYHRQIQRYTFQKQKPLLSLPLRIVWKAERIVRDWHLRRTKKFQPQDAIFTMGAFWQYRALIDFYQQKAKEGVILIGILHDLIGVIYPEYADKSRQVIFQKFLKLPMHLITVSEFTKRELEKSTAAGSLQSNYKSIKSIALAHEFVGADRVVDNAAAGRQKNPYVLFVSSLEPHKNHAALAAMWKDMYAELGDKLPQLIFAGKKGGAADKLLRDNNLGAKVTFREKPGNEELIELYKNCDFTVFPSLIEGWGLPVGESLWFGKACAASDRASIPEVGKELCVYFDPGNPEAMKAAITTLLDPERRRVFEDKIKSVNLRTWKDVAHDIETAVISILSAK